MQRFDSVGISQRRSAVVVNTTTSNDQKGPSIEMADDGSFIVVWSGEGAGDTQGVFGQKYAANGAAVVAEFIINQSTTGDQHEHFCRRRRPR